MTPLLLTAPWIALFLWIRFVARIPDELPAPGSENAGKESGGGTEGIDVSSSGGAVPMVSVIVPARNEAVNITNCLRSLARSGYPDFEIIVVDDRSTDHTGELARSVPRGRARRIEVVDGDPLPEGWLGKPWACHQGVERATGEILLFTDADTTHGPALLERAVAGLHEEGAELMTVVGRQLMETFWERLVQPHIFFLMLLRFPDFQRVARNRRWRDAIANGQFLLFRREAYEAIGGHVAVKDEVAEDLALAQHVKRSGLALRIRSAEEDLATRMYRSLGQLVEGWSKNIVMGGLESFPPLIRPLIPGVSLVSSLLFWIVPPVILGLAVTGGLPAGLQGAGDGTAWPTAPFFTWSAVVCAVSVTLWAYFTYRMRAPAAYGLLYPLGAAVVSFILLRAWVRGRTVEWKGRTYRLRPLSERA